MGKGNSMIMKGFSSEESEEVFDDEVQSSSEEQLSESQRSGRISEVNSGGDMSANKSVRSGVVEVKGDRSAGSEEAAAQEMAQNDDDMFEHGSEEESKLDWQQIFLQEKMMGEP